MNNKQIRCDICGYTMQHIISNLYKCPQCGLKLIQDKGVVSPLVKSDLRRFGIIWDGGFKVVQTDLYQLDILKLMVMSKNQGCIYYYNRLLEFIKKVDEINGTRFDSTRLNILPRIFLREALK